MKERPILFTPGNVRAILDGSKTQTRRMNGLEYVNADPDGFALRQQHDGLFFFFPKGGSAGGVLRCPYGVPGDRLWVREAWATSTALDHAKPSNLLPGFLCQYRAGGTSLHGVDTIQSRGKWRPSIFLPRNACRLVLEITEVRVQRLQDIGEDDCLAEGIVKCTVTKGRVRGDPDYDVFALEPGNHCRWEMTPQTVYRKLWESINGIGSWDANPWVWAITFGRVMP